jgi:hypothetical protein
MNIVKVSFDDGYFFTTPINATLEESKKYYIGRSFVYHECEESGIELSHKAIAVELV